jgi:hypothetical protein
LNPFPLFEEEAKMSIAQSPLQFPTEDSTQNTLAFKRKFNLSHSSSRSSGIIIVICAVTTTTSTTATAAAASSAA